jgi:hypothetical protein
MRLERAALPVAENKGFERPELVPDETWPKKDA